MDHGHGPMKPIAKPTPRHRQAARVVLDSLSDDERHTMIESFSRRAESIDQDWPPHDSASETDELPDADWPPKVTERRRRATRCTPAGGCGSGAAVVDAAAVGARPWSAWRRTVREIVGRDRRRGESNPFHLAMRLEYDGQKGGKSRWPFRQRVTSTLSSSSCKKKVGAWS